MARRRRREEGRDVRVRYNLPADLVSAIEGRAGELGLTVDEYVTERLRETTVPATVKMRVGAMVRDGKSDADIGIVLHYQPGRVADIRRSLGLPANRRYSK